MNLNELRIATDLAASNMTSTRLDEIWESMTYDSKQELVNAIRNYVTDSHDKDEAQTKAERLKAAIMSPVFQFEEAKIIDSDNGVIRITEVNNSNSSSNLREVTKGSGGEE